MIKSIGRTIGYFGPIVLKVFVIFNMEDTYTYQNNTYKRNKSFRKWVTYGNIESLSYSYTTFIQLDYSSICQNKEFYKDYRFNILMHQNWKLLKFIKKTLLVLEKFGNEIFYLDGDKNNQLSMYNISKKDLDKITITEFGFINNRSLYSIPAIIKDSQDRLYEGSRITFDQSNRYIDISYEELMGLYYILDKTDFVNLSQSFVSSIPLWYSEGIKHLKMEEVHDSQYIGEMREREALENENNIKNNSVTSNMNNNIFKGLIMK